MMKIIMKSEYGLNIEVSIGNLRPDLGGFTYKFECILILVVQAIYHAECI